jgi:hypothetical protein
MRAPLFIPAPSIQQAVFIHIDQEQLKRQIRILQKRTDAVQFFESAEKTPPKGRFVSFEQLACVGIDPDKSLLGGDGVDNADRIPGKETG